VSACVIRESADVRIHNGNSDQERRMKRNIFIAILGLGLLFGSTASSKAQVKRVQMHIAGFLCGN
jgi:hypothetical protein